jgi:hypothetical protein
VAEDTESSDHDFVVSVLKMMKLSGRISISCDAQHYESIADENRTSTRRETTERFLQSQPFSIAIVREAIENSKAVKIFHLIGS